KVGLFLTCILPRSLLVIKNAKSSSQIYDEDDHTITCLEWSNNVIQRWIHTSKVDCCDETEFQEQLDESLLNFSHKIQRKTTISDWDKESMPTSVIYHYAFMPPSAIAHVAEVVKQKIRYSALILIGLFIISLLGTVGYAIQYEQELKQNLRVLKRRTIAVSQLRMEAAEIEEKLAPIKEFPKQPVLTILESLNSIVPKDSWITHFHLEEGLVKIGGSSANPTALIEILSNHPDIYNVEQSGTFSGKRFNISFKLKIFDQNYWVKYFSRSQ
ncbi:MAG: PilN domain-containing protein, partial [Thiomargarita sp.]|nr:PilN domain-containing protein [Thiomargarita sp.]